MNTNENFAQVLKVFEDKIKDKIKIAIFDIREEVSKSFQAILNPLVIYTDDGVEPSNLVMSKSWDNNKANVKIEVSSIGRK